MLGTSSLEMTPRYRRRKILRKNFSQTDESQRYIKRARLPQHPLESVYSPASDFSAEAIR